MPVMRRRFSAGLHGVHVSAARSGVFVSRGRKWLVLVLILLSVYGILPTLLLGAEHNEGVNTAAGDDSAFSTSTASVTLLLPTIMDAEKAIRQWLQPSSLLLDVVCAWDGARSSPVSVSAVVVQMCLPGAELVDELGERMQLLAEQFPGVRVTERFSSLIANEGESWRSWSFTDVNTSARSCVREAVLVSLYAERCSTTVGYGGFHKYVKAGLASLTHDTTHFLVLADFLVPVLLAEDGLRAGRSAHRGFLQRLLLTTHHGGGKVAAVQCTILSKQPSMHAENDTHAPEDFEKKEGWGFVSSRLPQVPLVLHRISGTHSSRHLGQYVAADKGVLVGYGANWDGGVGGYFFTRRLSGYSALDERVLLQEEPVDAVSPFCTLFHRGLYDASGGFAPSPSVRSTSVSPGTMGWTLLRETPQPYDPAGVNYLERPQDAQSDVSTVWPDALQADDFVGWEFSLRVLSRFPGWQLWTSTAMALAWATPMELVAWRCQRRPSFRPVSEPPARRIMRYFAPSFVMTGSVSGHWDDFVDELFRNRSGMPIPRWGNAFARDTQKQVPPLIQLRVLSNYGLRKCSGMMTEGVHYIVPLQRRISVVFRGNRSQWCPGYSQSAMDALYRTQMGVGGWGRLAPWRQAQPEQEGSDRTEGLVGTTVDTARRKIKGNGPTVRITFIHSSPRLARYVTLDGPYGDYAIGRFLSENSRIAATHAEQMNIHLDEVWVTGEFFREVYKRSGVREELIHVMPESLDPYVIDPNLYTPFLGPPELEMQRHDNGTMRYWTNLPNGPSMMRREKRFRFLSVFKWESRKGWDVLLSAYWKAFGLGSPLHDEVSLYIKTGFPLTFADGVNSDNLEEKLTDWAKHVAQLPNFTSMKEFPHLVIIDNPIAPADDLLRLYRSSDAFVLPTRGEGWGLPTMEAMAMELPVLTTNWAGSTAFATRHNAFLIPVDGLEEIPEGSPYGSLAGSKWAIPSINGTAQLMEYVFRHPDHAKAVGRRARQDVLRKYSDEVVADKMNERFRTIAFKVERQRRDRWLWAQTMIW